MNDAGRNGEGSSTGRAGDAADNAARDRRRRRVYAGTFGGALLALTLLTPAVPLIVFGTGGRLPIEQRLWATLPFLLYSLPVHTALAALFATRVCRRLRVSDDAASVEETGRTVSTREAGALPGPWSGATPPLTVRADISRYVWGFAAMNAFFAVRGVWLSLPFFPGGKFYDPMFPTYRDDALWFAIQDGLMALLVVGLVCWARRRPTLRRATADTYGVSLTWPRSRAIPWAGIARCRVVRVRDAFGRPSSLTLELFGPGTGGKREMPLASASFATSDPTAREDTERLVAAVRAHLRGEECTTRPTTAAVAEVAPKASSLVPPPVAAADVADEAEARVVAGRGR